MSTSQQVCRDALARALVASRSELAKQISIITSGNALLAQSFVSPLERSIRGFDQQPILEWLRIVVRSYPRDRVRATIAAALGETLAIGERMTRTGVDLDLSGMIVFIKLVERDVERALQIHDPLRSAYVGPYQGAVEPIVRMLKARDEATCEHSLLTGAWCRQIADALNIPQIEADRIVVAGVLHDVGKIATPDGILFKTSPLDETEWTVMREHATDGGDILLDIPTLAEVAPIVRHHHERLDGLGYPDGLRGDDIPLGARIVAVADAYHAMTSNRPYREAFTIAKAIEILHDGRGKQWDPEMVDVMIQVAIDSRNDASDADLPSPESHRDVDVTDHDDDRKAAS